MGRVTKACACPRWAMRIRYVAQRRGSIVILALVFEWRTRNACSDFCDASDARHLVFTITGPEAVTLAATFTLTLTLTRRRLILPEPERRRRDFGAGSWTVFAQAVGR